MQKAIVPGHALCSLLNGTSRRLSNFGPFSCLSGAGCPPPSQAQLARTLLPPGLKARPRHRADPQAAWLDGDPLQRSPERMQESEAQEPVWGTAPTPGDVRAHGWVLGVRKAHGANNPVQPSSEQSVFSAQGPTFPVPLEGSERGTWSRQQDQPDA